MTSATVVGFGLAGAEAAYQLAKRGVFVTLVDMKPDKMSPAHHSAGMAELVCSNSLRSDRLTNAVGLLKEEMRRLQSLIIEAADKSRVPAGGALAVDRDAFSKYVTDTLSGMDNVKIESREVTEIPDGAVIIATGPLTSDALFEKISALPGLGLLHFYDAAAPIVTRESLNMDRVFTQSRYDRGDDYLNCPMTRDEYFAFASALQEAETAPVHGFEENMVFEGCMPVESMAKRGIMALAYGPLKPMGIVDPKTGKKPFANVQLRQDNEAGTLCNIVGFQTRLTFPEQRRVFGMIPGLENAVFSRYGVMHRNTFLQSPGFLDRNYGALFRRDLFFAGQMTGVEGYVESAASGLVAGITLSKRLSGEADPVFPRATELGALGSYVAAQNRDFQPMNASFGLMDASFDRIKDRQKRYQALAERSLSAIDELNLRF
ncbi:MAG: methylenetetrahydrofolate--tRNA-(uracil(54)-C(5))-methyltransferase (FADH(2)-oxidizing) TrmFO [Eubacteriales bacterium]|nr:methylenetetrahydrofolate--tRNA-(uracil(54)-C(5))-methyltransferase (FADH(2)-oxidizing) TrmFO [Eubacteriales bacterium]MDD3880744.1 methylenetetrahydrofolate--tRNA-(uracil(54)-C(5))-methyltransferase (FADH(2)-oxidizing) TrmFO [Eubacteriales bacterium]MDD3882909.1 methylenetetrahydrofolate--tRNA-(uracil(54)-C(5))-methyltransferase (FADH(2)-oxidizing) TrmFO [Eubacteriales bacterium]MDD4511623.1 methylenetetrahydrofolate--tRNA-(uracil(54)-C(5))-methyltransferase (FADH(2)-oxidizing) TrmFO [Eubact